MNAAPEIHGHPPTLAGSACDDLRCEEYWHRGELVDALNVIYLLAAGAWHRLAFDCGVIFWRVGDGAPASSDSPGTGDHYRVVDLGARLGVLGCRIERYEMKRIDGGAEVVFHFAGGRSLSFRNVDDRTSLAV